MTSTHTTTIRSFRTGSHGRVSRVECSCGYFGSNGTKREAEADERRHAKAVAKWDTAQGGAFWEHRVRELEAQGLNRSDAQAAADAEAIR